MADPVLLGADYNCCAQHDLLHADDRKFVMRYVSDDGYQRNATRDEVMDLRAWGIKVGLCWQGGIGGEGHSEEVWWGYKDEAPGFASGQAVAETARDLVRRIMNRTDMPIPFTGDQPNTGAASDFPWMLFADFLEGTRTVIGKARNWMYGSGFLCRKIMELDDPPVSGYWLSWLLDGMYWGPPRPKTKLADLPFKANMIQYANADQDDTLPRFGTTPQQTYVALDRGTPGMPLPIAYPL